jgi:hypothetical protein
MGENTPKREIRGVAKTVRENTRWSIFNASTNGRSNRFQN